MSARVYAIDGLQALFGRDSVDDALWRDIERFELAALPIINRIWNLAELNHQDRWMVLHAYDEVSRALHEQRLAEALQAFETALAGDKPASCAAAFLLHPQLWQSFYHRETHHYVYHYFAS